MNECLSFAAAYCAQRERLDPCLAELVIADRRLGNLPTSRLNARKKRGFMTRSNSVPKGYWVVVYRNIRDPSKLADYGRLAVPAIETAGGRVLSRDGAIEVHEAGERTRTVLVEFASFEQACAAYRSPLYRAALDALGTGAERDVRIVEGLDRVSV